MIIHDYSVEEIESRFFNYLSGKIGNFKVVEHLSQMSGGWEAYLYKFVIRGVEGYEGPMVLRLFPSYSHPETAEWQGMLHNLLLEEEIPVPKVYLTCSDFSILNGPFLIMDFVEGEAIDPGDDPSILLLTGEAQARLHLKDGRRISERIMEHGHSRGSHVFDGHFGWIQRNGRKYEGLLEVIQWLVVNRPTEPEVPSIIHGDFHPMNLLVKDGKIETILDWSGFMVGDPMYGLGWTKALFIATGKHEIPEEMFNQLVQMYNDAYESVRPIDFEKVDYYVVYRLVRALIEGKEGQEIWRRPDIVQNIINELKVMTGITVTI
jgi:aminoglycoside phosphotransferase (APT) family kinase protein